MSPKRQEYEEIDAIKDPDGMGLVAPITRMIKPNGYQSFSYAIMKEFERFPGGPTERSSFLNERHAEAAHKLIDLAVERIAVEHDKMQAQRREERQKSRNTRSGQ